MAGPAMVEPMKGGEFAQKGLVRARSLVDGESEVIPSRAFNPGRGEKVARERTTVGTLSIVEADSG